MCSLCLEQERSLLIREYKVALQEAKECGLILGYSLGVVEGFVISKIQPLIPPEKMKLKFGELGEVLN